MQSSQRLPCIRKVMFVLLITPFRSELLLKSVLLLWGPNTLQDLFLSLAAAEVSSKLVICLQCL